MTARAAGDGTSWERRGDVGVDGALAVADAEKAYVVTDVTLHALT